MTSILKQLSGYSKESAELNEAQIEAQAALAETAKAIEDADTLSELAEVVDDGADDLQEIADDIQEQGDAIANSITVSGAVESVVDQTLETYGEDGITEEGAALLKLSVESILRTGGISIPVEMAVPSFESGMTRAQYSTEAEEKKGNIITRIFAWIATAFKSLIESVKNFWSRLVNSVASLEAYAQRVKKQIADIKGAAKEDKMAVGGWGVYLTTNGSTVSAPRNVVKAAVTSYSKFASQWDGSFGDLNKINMPGGIDIVKNIDALVEGIKRTEIGKLSGIRHFNDMELFPTHTLKMATGPDGKWPLAGAKFSIVAKKGTAPKTVPVLPIDEMNGGIDECLLALKVVDKIQEKTKSWEKNATRIRTWAGVLSGALNNSEGRRGFTKEQNAEAQGAVKTLISGSTIMTQGWAQSIQIFLTVIKNNIRYCSASAGHYGKELKSHNPLTDVKALSHQPA